MNTVIDSGSWTGLSSEPRDPYAVLKANERKGELRFDGGRRAIVWRFLSATFLLFVGAMLIGTYWFGIESVHPTSDLIVGLLLIVIGAGALVAWQQRVKRRDKIVPLLINDRELRFGTPPRLVRIDTIRTIILPAVQESLPDLAYTLSDRASAGFVDRALSLSPPVSSTTLATMSPTINVVVAGQDEPISLDLAMLKGDASRIALIICDRVQKYQSLAGTKDA